MGRFRQWYEGILHLPKVNQTHDYDCGAAALRSVAHYYGVGPEDEGEFIRICDTSKTQGTEPTDIIKAARKLGLHIHAQQHMTVGTLKQFIDSGKPVICAVQAWGDEKEYKELEKGHYVVAIGYNDDYIFFEDPSIKGVEKRGHMSDEDFVRRWVDVDRKGKVLRRYGIVLWAETGPDEQDVVNKSIEIW
jgi:predicted double-glycine peptidase